MIDDAHVVDALFVVRVEEDQVADGGEIVRSGEELALLEALGHEGGRRVVGDVLGRDAGIAQAEGDEHRAPLVRVRCAGPGAVTGIAVPDPGVACVVQNSFKVVLALAVTLLGGGHEDKVLCPVSAELHAVEVALPVGRALKVRVRIADGHLGNGSRFRLGTYFRLIDGDLFLADAFRPVDMGCQLLLAAGELPNGLVALGGVGMRALAFRNLAAQFPHGLIALGGMGMRALALRNLAGQDAVFIIAGFTVLMTGVFFQGAAQHFPLGVACVTVLMPRIFLQAAAELFPFGIAGVTVLMPRILLQGAGEHLALGIACVRMRVCFQFRQRADKGLPVVAVVVVHMRHRLRPLMGIGAVQHLPGIDLRHRRLAEAGKGPQRDDHRQTQNQRKRSGPSFAVFQNPVQQRFIHVPALPFE